MEICTECRVVYPAHLLSPFIACGKESKPVCGICALRLSNTLHGFKRRRFQGEIAEEMRQEAVAWRRKSSGRDKEGKG